LTINKNNLPKIRTNSTFSGAKEKKKSKKELKE